MGIKKIIKGVNDIATTHPNLVKYFKNIEDAYTHSFGSNDKIWTICPDCGFEKKMSINNLHIRGFSCLKCGDKISYGEKLMFSVLKKINIEFQIQLSKTTFDWCDKYKYDFYFENDNVQYIIETHGEQHYKETTGSWKYALKDVQENDKLKKELVMKNGIKEKNYIVIDCRYSNLDFIKQNILKSRLNELFDLNIIDWEECGEFALSNRVKEACILKRDNPDLTTSDIGNIMKIGKQTIIKYLKKGSEIWDWINYDPKEEQRKSASKAVKLKQKAVKIFKNNILLGLFESALELEKQSEKLFGVKLCSKNISAVCTNKVKTHKGYTFSFC
jgi:hypothetical protein